MNNYILISRTFAEITPESCADSDFSDHGFIDEKQECTFSELVTLMREHNIPSCSPNDYGVNVWYSTDFYTTDYSTGTNREESIHFHRDNTPNAAKYWKWAAIIANKK